MSKYIIDCTGDVCVGDEVLFVRDVLERKPTNSYGKLSWVKTGEKTIEGKVLKESYGSEKQQHTFTISLLSGEKVLIKGRNLYRNGVKRKVWSDEEGRKSVLAEKHSRGKNARELKTNRKNNY